jgi:hypothetical protein
MSGLLEDGRILFPVSAFKVLRYHLWYIWGKPLYTQEECKRKIFFMKMILCLQTTLSVSLSGPGPHFENCESEIF